MFDDDELDEEVCIVLDEVDDDDELFTAKIWKFDEARKSSFERDEYEATRLARQLVRTDEILVSEILLHIDDDEVDECVQAQLEEREQIDEVDDDLLDVLQQHHRDVLDNEIDDELDCVFVDDDDDDDVKLDINQLQQRVDDSDDVDIWAIFREQMFDIRQVEADDEQQFAHLDVVDDDTDQLANKLDEMQQHIDLDDDEQVARVLRQFVANDEIDVSELHTWNMKLRVDTISLDEILVSKRLIDIAFTCSRQIERLKYDSMKLTAWTKQSFSKIFCAFTIVNYNTIAFISYLKKCQKRNKRKQQQPNQSKQKKRLWFVLIDDFDAWLQWVEQSQQLQKKEEWKWLHRGRLYFDEIRSLKVCIDLMTEICSQMWFVETIILNLSPIRIPHFSMTEWIDLKSQAEFYDLKKLHNLVCFLQNTKRSWTHSEWQTSRKFCFNRSEVLFKTRYELTNRIVHFMWKTHNILRTNWMNYDLKSDLSFANDNRSLQVARSLTHLTCVE